MKLEVKELKQTAEEGRMLYRTGQVEIKEAKQMIMPYLKAVNEYSAKIAKEYGMKPRKVNFYAYCR